MKINGIILNVIKDLQCFIQKWIIFLHPIELHVKPACKQKAKRKVKKNELYESFIFLVYIVWKINLNGLKKHVSVFFIESQDGVWSIVKIW